MESLGSDPFTVLHVSSGRKDEKSLHYFNRELWEGSFVHRSSQNYFLSSSFFYEIHRMRLYHGIFLRPAAWHRGLLLPASFSFPLALCFPPWMSWACRCIGPVLSMACACWYREILNTFWTRDLMFSFSFHWVLQFMWPVLLTRVLPTNFDLGERQSDLDEKRKRRSFKILVERKPQLKIWEGRADSNACAQSSCMKLIICRFVYIYLFY